MYSTLSPNAPEFIPELKNVTQDGYLTIKRSVKSSKIFTTKKFDSLKAFPAFKSVISEFSRYVMSQIEEIVVAEIPKIVFTKEEGEQCEEEYILQANNNILERFHRNVEAFSKMDNLPDTHKNNQNIPPAEDVPITEDQVEVDQYELNMAQALAPTPNPDVYSAEHIWVPIIPEKPNYVLSFELKLLHDESGKAIGYEHPYRVELEQYEPPSYLIDAVAKPISFPAPLKNTNYTFINTLPKLEELVRHLREVDEMAVDVEHHSLRAYIGVTCLVQITTYKGDFIIDAIALRPHLHRLNCPFTDPKKIKVLHGADMDILWLQRDLGVYIVGLFDTYQAAIILNLRCKSLKALLKLYCKINTDKKYQTADWRVRPLPYSMVRYARTDTHYLLYIWKRMKNQLLEKGTNCVDRSVHLKYVFKLSKNVCSSTYRKRPVTETSHLSLYQRYIKEFELSSRSLFALKKLYKWRDDYSKEHNEGPAYVLPNTMMLTLAKTLPTDLKGVRACCPLAKKGLRRNFIKLLEILQVCLDIPEPPPVVLPVRFRRRRKMYRHMLDLPRTSTSAVNDNIVMNPEDSQVFDDVEEPLVTINSNGGKDHGFCSPYHRYVKFGQQKEKNEVEREVGVMENTNAENKRTQFTPIFKSRETREREAEERAKENPAEAEAEDEDDAGEGTSDGFTLVTRRKRKVRGKNDAHNPEASKPTPSSKRLYYQYTNPNYKSIYNPRDKEIAKLVSKKRK